jgi:glycosyltransferase involved in cell wall biosynthesis
MLGGGEHSFLELLTHLPEPWIPLAIVPAEGKLLVNLRSHGVESEVMQLPQIRPWKALQVFACIIRLLNLYNRKKPDLIYANNSRAAFYGGILGKLTRVPVVWHCRISEADFLMDNILVYLCQRIVANSRATLNRFGPRFRSKVRIVYNGININWLKGKVVTQPANISKKWKIILLVARASKMKRHDLAISAFEKAAEQIHDLHLVCVGDKDCSQQYWWDYLQKKTAESPFKKQIHWVGHVDDVRPWYRAASMLIFPSENEAFGRVLVEAMACSLPIIAVRSGGVPEVIRHAQDGWLVTPGSEVEITDAILKLLSDSTFKNRVAMSAEQRAHSFDLKVHVNGMVRIFNEVSLAGT